MNDISVPLSLSVIALAVFSFLAWYWVSSIQMNLTDIKTSLKDNRTDLSNELSKTKGDLENKIAEGNQRLHDRIDKIAEEMREGERFCGESRESCHHRNSDTFATKDDVRALDSRFNETIRRVTDIEGRVITYMRNNKE